MSEDHDNPIHGKLRNSMTESINHADKSASSNQNGPQIIQHAKIDEKVPECIQVAENQDAIVDD